MRSKRIEFISLLALLSALLIPLAACQREKSVVGDGPETAPSSSKQSPEGREGQSSSMAPPTAAPSTSPTPTGGDDSKGGPKADAKGGSAQNVPEMMKRAFTKEEMDKAMEQLPPEIRSRLKGMTYSPAGPRVGPVGGGPTPPPAGGKGRATPTPDHKQK